MTASRTYRGATAQQRRDERRAALVDAALDCLHEGVAVGVRAVCARARLTPRYFYESFTDADALLLAAIDAAGQEVLTRSLAAVAAAGDDPVAQVRAAVSTGYGAVADDPRVGSAFLVAAAGRGAVRDRRDEIVEQYAAHVMASVDAVQVRTTAVFVMGGTVDVIQAVLSGRIPMSRRRVIDELTALWLGALGLR